MASKVPGFKQPKRIFITDDVPRTATGKIQRRIVSAHFQKLSETPRSKLWTFVDVCHHAFSAFHWILAQLRYPFLLALSELRARGAGKLDFGDFTPQTPDLRIRRNCWGDHRLIRPSPAQLGGEGGTKHSDMRRLIFWSFFQEAVCLMFVFGDPVFQL